jgi:glucose dehydrogenase
VLGKVRTVWLKSVFWFVFLMLAWELLEGCFNLSAARCRQTCVIVIGYYLLLLLIPCYDRHTEQPASFAVASATTIT